MEKEEIDYKLAAEQLRTGKPLFGKGQKKLIVSRQPIFY